MYVCQNHRMLDKEGRRKLHVMGISCRGIAAFIPYVRHEAAVQRS
jgi:hypothetical protein